MKSNFILEADTTQKITKVLEKNYHNYYEGIAKAQNSRSGDIVEITNRNQIVWENQFSLTTDELIDNIRIPFEI